MNWESNPDTFKSAISNLVASGGDDPSEVSLDAIDTALSQGFPRPEAQKVVLVITDAPSHQKTDGTIFAQYTEDEVRSHLVSSGATLIVVSPTLNRDTYVGNVVDLKDLAGKVGGTWIDMNSGEFSTILDKFTAILTGTYVIEYATPTKAANESKNISISVKKPPCEGTANITSPLVDPSLANPSQNEKEPEISKVGRFFYAGNGTGGIVNDPFHPGYNVTVT